MLSSERKEDTTDFLNRALAWLGRHGVSVERVMTDNGSAYRSGLFRKALAEAGVRHVRTRPYTPRTNGKAERFIQTALRDGPNAKPSDRPAERPRIGPGPQLQLAPHSGLKGAHTLAAGENLLGNDT